MRRFFHAVFCGGMMVFSALSSAAQPIEYHVTEVSPIPPGKAYLLTMKEAVEYTLSTGQVLKIPADSQWSSEGVVINGVIFRSKEHALWIEEGKKLEAFMVVQPYRDELTGFYVPEKEAVIKIDPPLKMNVGMRVLRLRTW